VTRLAAGDDITSAARYANVVAALSVMHRGPSSGPSVEAVAAFLSTGAGRP
jgi:sugar/nucleoside kinase (ribokinase family)